MLLRSPLLLALAALAVSASSEPSSELPSSSVDEICHPSTGCYPREFVPSTTFETVHDDQQLPPGLHIRLNLSTGKKEAKLLDPNEDDAATDASINSSHNDLILVDDDSNKESAEASTLNPAAASYSPPAGTAHEELSSSIRPPANAGDEATIFTSAVSVLTAPTPAPAAEVAVALSSLEELAHSLYWGATLCKSRPATAALLNLLTPAQTASMRASAALVLGSALSNNPAALAGAGPVALARPLLIALDAESDALVRKRLLFALAQTLGDSLGRAAFVRAGGISSLMRVWDQAHADDAEVLRGRVAVLIEDAFLDETMRRDDSDDGGDKLKVQMPDAGIMAAGEEVGEGEGREAVDEAFCAPFQTALIVPMRDQSQAGKVLSALLKLRLGGRCALLDGVSEWARDAQLQDQNEGGLGDMVRENKALLGV